MNIFEPKISRKIFLVAGIRGKVCDIFQLLLCLCYVYITTLAVCVSAFGHLKLQRPKILRYLLTRVRISYQITDFANECVLSFLAEVFYLHVFLNVFL